MNVLDETMKTKIDLLFMQARQFQLRAEWIAKRIETGAWKVRIGHVFHGDGRPFTDQEILDDEVHTMQCQVENASCPHGYLLTTIPT